MVVRMRHTKGHTANRRSHHALKGARFVVCEKCNKEHLMHRVCANCGTYRGREVVDTMKKTLRVAKKAEKKGAEVAPAEEVKETKEKKKDTKKKEEKAAE